MSKPELVKLIDTTLCTACRGCQVACKQWNEMPGLRTKQFGSYQNPPDLQWNTWTLIRFQEYEDAQGISTGSSAKTAACTVQMRPA